MPGRILISVEINEYTIVEYENGRVLAYKAGNVVRDFTGDKLTFALLHRLAELEKWYVARTR